MAEWQDDNTISNEEGLLRRVPNWPNMVKFDANTNEIRPSSACFSDKDGGEELSVTIETPHLAGGGTYESAAKEDGWGLAKVIAGTARTVSNPSQKLVRNPTPDDPHHGLVVGKKTRAAKRNLAKAAEMVVTPDMTN